MSEQHEKTCIERRASRFSGLRRRGSRRDPHCHRRAFPAHLLRAHRRRRHGPGCPGGRRADPGGGRARDHTPPTGGKSNPDIEITSAVDCGSPHPASTADCEPIVVRSTGTTALRVTSLEWKGKSVKDFKVHKDGCTKRNLAPGKSCTISVRFDPGGSGSRTAQLVVHQNLPGPASTVNLTGTGPSEPTPDPTDPPTPTTTDQAR